MKRHLAAILAADVAGYSRMMADDEAATLTTLKACMAEVVEPAVGRRGGRIFKTMGDGFLAEFPSVVEAVSCAGDIQAGMAVRNQRPGALPMLMRIGVHLGDVIAEGDDVFGDGVNVAARLQALADAGGIRLSRQAYDQVEGKLGVTYRALGEQSLKNMARPVAVYAAEFGAAGAGTTKPELKQEIKYCRASDGTRLAYATIGQGPVLVKTAHWLSHLELDWESPAWRPLLGGLAQDRTVIRYDARGNGMSDWDVDDISLDAWVSDLECVVEANGLQRFPLLGISQGCPVAISYAVRHPERISHLILYGGFAVGSKYRDLTAEQLEEFAAMRTLTRLGWGADNPAFRQMFTTQFMPEATKEQWDSFNNLQRQSASAECAVRYLEAVANMNVVDLLPKVQVPTLVLHVRGDARVPIDLGRRMAAGIPGARFVAMPGRNHIMLEGEPAMARFLEEVRLFLGG
jgi:class 3 adenylate cyclase/pimeloyl-ACP methyl ester carboxylesterase